MFVFNEKLNLNKFMTNFFKSVSSFISKRFFIVFLFNHLIYCLIVILGNAVISKCSRCGKGYTNIASLRKHINYYCGRDKISCSYCPFKTIYPSNMKTHMVLKHKPSELVFFELWKKCSIINLFFFYNTH